ncbi:MAG: hypothetical protein CMB74_01135 [Euryarchaeota archaeon]|nr:hypothetical protein [Euryarchaeota archaeon]
MVEGVDAPQESITLVKPNQSMNRDDLFLMKLSQIVMMGIGFLAIWGGVFSVAFDEDATNQNFLVLFVGGLASFLVSIGLIELQSKKNGYRLKDIQNYFLGIAFFFSTVGVLWGTRFMMGYATGTLELDWFGSPDAYTEVDWSPNANGIYAQTATCLLLTFGHFLLLRRYSGDTSFGWGVATYAPMAVLIAGVGPWIRWSESVVSWELGLAIVLISFVSMEMALRSNRALNFVVVAVAACIVPIIYEVLNTNAPDDGMGGALSLMVFIIALQGYYASRQDLRKEVMERASAVLIGTVVVAIALARTEPDFNLILGPFRASDYPELAAYVNIPVALWVTVLLAYFPAVLQQRVPWMPVGLAVALAALPPETSTMPWVLSMIMIPYMVFISKVARAWVINITILAFSGSYLITDWMGISADLTAQDTYGGTWLHVLLPIFLVAVSEAGRRTGKIQTSTSLAMLGSVVLSRAVLDPEWFLPWLLVAYMAFMSYSMMLQYPSPNMKQRKDITLALAFTSVTVLLLAALDNLKLPPSSVFDDIVAMGLRPQFFVVSLVLYFLAAKAAGKELDVGSIYHWFGIGNQDELIYNPNTNVWEIQDPKEKDLDAVIEDGELTPLARFSLLSSLMMFTFSVSNVNASTWSDQPALVLLMVIPVGMLIREVLAMASISSATRATAVTLLLLIAAPLSLALGDNVWGTSADIQMSNVLLDLILVSAPIIVNTVIARRGIDTNELDRMSDGVAYVMLLLLAMLDTSGGLLLLPILLLVTMRVVQFKFYLLLSLMPLVLVFLGQGWYSHGLFNTMLEGAPDSVRTYLLDDHAGPFPAFIGLIIGTQMLFGLSRLYTSEDDELESSFTMFIMGIWLAIALFSAIPDGYWLPTLACFVLLPYFWFTNNSQTFPYMLGALFVSLYIGFSLSETFQPITEADAIGWSGMITGLTGSAMAIMHQRGVLFRTPPTTEEDINLADSTASLALQLGALGYVGGYSVFFGIGPVIGLVLLARSALKDGRPNSIIALPILLTFSVVNLLVQAEVGTDDQRQTITGMTLAVQGLLLSLLSARDDMVYDYKALKWDSDESFFAFMDRLGVSGALYTIIGLFVAFDSVNLESIAYLLTTVYLVVIGIQGFSDEADARWRRGVGGYGSILTAFLFANSLESDIYNAIGIVLTGMVALGFSFLFMQRMNEEDGIYEMAEYEDPGSTDDGPKNIPAMVDLDAGVEDEEDDELEAELAALDLEEEEDDADLEVLDEAVEEEDDLEIDLVDDAEDEEEETASEPVVDQKVEETKPVQAPKPKKAHSGLLDTGEGFALRLPKDAVQNILSSLEQTPHEGYVPVVAFGPNGQIMLTFETDNSNA